MNLRKKLMLAPIVILGMQAFSFTALLWVFQSYKSNSIANQQQIQLHFENLSSAQQALAKQHAGLYRTVAISSSLDDLVIQQLRDKLAQQLAAVSSAIRLEIAAHPSEALQAAAQRFGEQILQYGKAATSAIDLSTVDANTGIAAMQRADARFVEIDTTLSGIFKLIKQSSDSDLGRFEKLSDIQRLCVGLLALLLGIASVVFAWRMQRQIVRDLSICVQATQDVALGQLDVILESERADELGDMVRSLGAMVKHLGTTIELVQQTADSIKLGSQGITADNHELKSRIELQAVSLEETVHAMQALTGAVTQNADNAFQANQLAQSASEVAIKGGDAVSQVVSTMESIHVSATKIADIISVIDGIAFQTNILALNAAVEAARAGESGRGFAVVASEVRALAQRSAAAAKQINNLISNSGELVQVGMKLADQAGATMKEIVSSVQNVTRLLGEIATASQAQRTEIEQVNLSMGKIDESTRKNRALVEQTAVATVSLQSRASYLAKAIGEFKLDKRAATRKPLVCSGQLKLPSGASLEMQTIDLSRTGVGLELAENLSKGQLCEVHFDMPFAGQRKQRVMVKAHVSYCLATERGTYKAGLQFIDSQQVVVDTFGQLLA